VKVFVQILVAAALAASAGCSGGHGSAQSVGSTVKTTGSRGPLLALVGQGVTADLRWLHPGSLTPIHGRRTLAMGEHDTPWAFSPNRSEVAIGSGRVDSLEIVNLTRMAVIKTVQTGFTAALAWPARGRVLLVETSRGGGW
jgi:hypothetical protein